MDRHRSSDGDVHDPSDPSSDVDDRVLHLVAPRPVVGDGVQFAGHRVTLGVGGVPAGKGAVEVGRPDGLQLLGQLVGARAGLDDRVGPSRVRDHVGVGGEVHPLDHRSGMDRLPERSRHVRRADPAVPVPARRAVPETDPVHHPLTGEPVIGGRVRRSDRVRSVSEVTAVQRVGQRAGDREIGHRLLGADRSVVVA